MDDVRMWKRMPFSPIVTAIRKVATASGRGSAEINASSKTLGPA